MLSSEKENDVCGYTWLLNTSKNFRQNIWIGLRRLLNILLGLLTITIQLERSQSCKSGSTAILGFFAETTLSKVKEHRRHVLRGSRWITAKYVIT